MDRIMDRKYLKKVGFNNFFNKRKSNRLKNTNKLHGGIR